MTTPSDNQPVLMDSPPGGTRLITDQGDQPKVTLVHQTDVRTALARGLAEYLKTVQTQMEGRSLRFKDVFFTWAEPEDPGQYPSAIVWANDPGDYDSERFTPGLGSADKVPGTPDHYLMQPCEFVQLLYVEVWATGRQERMALTAMLEDAFFPVSWMYGFRLDLPHYYGMRGVYEPLNMNYLDNAEDARRRFRKVGISILARAPVVRVVAPLGTIKSRMDLRVTDEPDPSTIPTGTKSDPTQP